MAPSQGGGTGSSLTGRVEIDEGFDLVVFIDMLDILDRFSDEEIEQLTSPPFSDVHSPLGSTTFDIVTSAVAPGTASNFVWHNRENTIRDSVGVDVDWNRRVQESPVTVR